MSFESDMAAIIAKTTKKMSGMQRIVVFSAFNQCVDMSPVGNPSIWKDQESAPPGYAGGRFRANWDYSFNNMPTETYDVVDPTGQSSRDRLASGFVDQPGIHWIANNLPYAEALELGHSKQAPEGIVNIVALGLDQMVQDAAA